MDNRSARIHAGERGFTLIELLIVIGIIGFLAAAILVAVDPVKRIQDSRDARRYAEVNAVLNALLNKQVDDRALYSGESTAPIITAATNAQIIVRDDTGIDCDTIATRPGCDASGKTFSTADGKACVANLAGAVPDYIAELPLDPRGTGTGPCETGSGCTLEGDIDIGDGNTGYYIHRTTGNRIEIGACAPEQVTAISVKR